MGKAATKFKGIAMIALMQLVYFFPAAAMAGEATLAWSPPQTNTDGSKLTDLAGYKVHYGTSSASYSNSIDVGYVTTYKLSGLADGSTYYFAVSAYNATGREGSKSAQVSKTMVRDTAGPALTGILAANVTTDSATITWGTDELSDTQVEYGTTASFGYVNPKDSTMTTAHSQTIAGLAPSTTYYFRVTSTDASGNTSTSQAYTLTTAAPVDSTPPVISNIAVTDITSNTARISWTTDEPSTTMVEYGANLGSTTPVLTDLTTVHSVTITGLSSFTTYDYRVRSVDSSGNTGASDTASFITSNMAPSVGSLSSDVTGGTVPANVTFTAGASDSDGNIVSYEWDFDGDGVYDYSSGASPTASHTYSAVGNYNARVRIRDNGGATAESDLLPITVESSTSKPPVIVSISATPSQDGSSYTFSFKIYISTTSGSVARIDWDFDGNGTIDASTSTSPAVFTYSGPGNYNPAVTVVDTKGSVAKSMISLSVQDIQGGTSGTSGADTSGSGSSGSSSGGGGGGCFIASAAYGSYLEPEVKVLRDFRDNVLLTSQVGRAFVDFYYRVSPPVADVISHHPVLKFAVRTVLTPIVYGMKYPGALAAIFLLSLIAVFRSRLKRLASR